METQQHQNSHKTLNTKFTKIPYIYLYAYSKIKKLKLYKRYPSVVMYTVS